MVDIRDLLDGKWEDGTRPKDIFEEHVAKQPSRYVDDVLEGLTSEKKRVQSGCAILASFLAEQEPRLLYPHLPLFQANLEAKEPVMRWEAVCTLGNLVAVDRAGKIRENVGRISSFLVDESIVLQVHALRALTKIARAFPDTAPTVFEEILRAKGAFPGNRIGFVLESMPVFAGDKKLRARARKFVESYVDSNVKVVAAKARKALKGIPGD